MPDDKIIQFPLQARSIYRQRIVNPCIKRGSHRMSLKELEKLFPGTVEQRAKRIALICEKHYLGFTVDQKNKKAKFWVIEDS